MSKPDDSFTHLRDDPQALEIYNRIVSISVDRGCDESVAHDIAFHMTDWIDDYRRLQDFYENPTLRDAQAVEDLLAGFLIHAPNHLAAAAKLFVDSPVSDIFGVGSTEDVGHA